MEHFHRRSCEIQGLLLSQEPPLELQVRSPTGVTHTHTHTHTYTHIHTHMPGPGQTCRHCPGLSCCASHPAVLCLVVSCCAWLCRVVSGLVPLCLGMFNCALALRVHYCCLVGTFHKPREGLSRAFRTMLCSKA